MTNKNLSQILKISKETRLKINSLFNLKAFLNHLKEDYRVEDIVSFFILKLKEYKDKIHFMMKCPLGSKTYKNGTDFYSLVGEFKDTHTSKWKMTQARNFYVEQEGCLSSERFVVNEEESEKCSKNGSSVVVYKKIPRIKTASSVSNNILAEIIKKSKLTKYKQEE